MITLPRVEVSLTREYMMSIRQALLMELDALERLLDISPRTAELRKMQRAVNPPPHTPAEYNCELEFQQKEGE